MTPTPSPARKAVVRPVRAAGCRRGARPYAGARRLRGL